MATHTTAYSLSGTDWQSLLATLYKVKTTPIDPARQSFPPDALRSINAIAHERLGDGVYAQLRHNWALTDAALIRAKKGELDQAREGFAAAAGQFSQLPPEALQLAQVLYNSRIAYYYYRSGQFEEAERSLANTLALDDQLQAVYPVLHGHKLHVLQNRSRTLALRKKYAEGADLVLDLMQYMINPGHRPYPVGTWGKKWVEQEAAIQATPVAFEFTLFYLCRDAHHYPSFETAVVTRSKRFVRDLGKVAHTHPVYQTTLDWFEAKQALYLHDDINLYIQRTNHFLEHYSERYNLLKLLLLMDLFRALKLLGLSAESNAIHAFIDEYHALRLAA